MSAFCIAGLYSSIVDEREEAGFSLGIAWDISLQFGVSVNSKNHLLHPLSARKPQCRLALTWYLEHQRETNDDANNETNIDNYLKVLSRLHLSKAVNYQDVCLHQSSLSGGEKVMCPYRNASYGKYLANRGTMLPCKTNET